MDKMARLGILVGAGVVAAGPRNQIPVTVMNNSELPVKRLQSRSKRVKLSTLKPE